MRPEARKGRFLIGSSLGLGALSWGLAFAQVGRLRGCSSRLDEGAEINANNCLYEGDAGQAALGSLRALSNVGNWGLAGAAGAVRGNYDAIDHVWTGHARRRDGAFIGGGIALAIAGMVTSGVAAGALLSNCEGPSCPNNLAMHIVAQQTASTMFTAGVGMFTYGVVYRYEYNDNTKYKNRLARSIRASPTVTANFAGASLSGRF